VVNWYIEVMRKYAVFSGRAQRQEYWMFVLLNIIIVLVLGVIEGILDSDSGGSRGVLGTLYGLAVLIPGLAVSVRRIHDTGQSGWWLLIVLIPVIGAIILLIFMVQSSRPTRNQYGPSPRREVTRYQQYSADQP
jgi:uncharacterized membrane protein YhaH (DUF805 family)